MKNNLLILVLAVLLCSCSPVKKLEDGVYIHQRTSLSKDYPQIDSILIVANVNSETQRIIENVMNYFKYRFKKILLNKK